MRNFTTLLVLLCLATNAQAYSLMLETRSTAQTEDADRDTLWEVKTWASTPQASINPILVQTGESRAFAYSVAHGNGGSLAVLAHGVSEGEVTSSPGFGLPDAVITTSLAEGTLIIDDLIFTGPGHSTVVTLNILVSGYLFNLPQANNHVTAYTSSYVTLGVNWNHGATEFSGSQSKIVEQTDYLGPLETHENAGGDFAGVDFPHLISLGEYSVSLNTPYTLRLFLGVSARTNLTGHGIGFARADSDFGHTVSFPQTGPVFNIEEGYSVSSVSADIVDNQWLGTPVEATLVPLPPALWLLVPALSLLGLRRARPTRVERGSSST